MPQKSQTKGKKKLILSILILILIAIIGYLGFTAQSFFQSKAEQRLVDTIGKNGYRITYDNFSTDNIFLPSEITADNITLRKIDSSITIQSPNLIIEFDETQSKTTLKSPSLSFTLAKIRSQDNIEVTIKSTDIATITHYKNIFDIVLPKQLTLSLSDEPAESIITFKQSPLLTHTYSKHEGTGEVTNRSLDLKPNFITISSNTLSTQISIDSNKLYFNFDNLGFNQIVNLESDQIIKLYDNNQQVIEDLTTNFNIDLTYKGTLTTGVNNSLKIKNFNLTNNKFSSVITANLTKSEMDMIPSGEINIGLSNISFFVAEMYDSMVSDDVAPQYVKNAKFHTIYNMEESEFAARTTKFASYLNNKDITSNEFNLTIKREANSMIFLNQHDLQNVMIEFNKIFFSNSDSS
ncbi:MAG: hypothetical protein HOM96_06015 [Rickettsiales bacterium]|mgnify:CR=1 FL=1|jgi:hypothetical protein|nr:hypothetical protein [Rickettsiales bacterium]